MTLLINLFQLWLESVKTMQNRIIQLRIIKSFS